MASCAGGGSDPIPRLSGPAFGVVAFFGVFGCTAVGHALLAFIDGMFSSGDGPDPLRVAVLDGFTGAVALAHFLTWPGRRRQPRLVLTTLRAAWGNACLCWLATVAMMAMPLAPSEWWAFLWGPPFVSTFGAILWVPTGLLYAAGLAPLFRGELAIAATPSRDVLRRATWLAARWGLGAALVAALLSSGGAHAIALALASGAAALVVLDSDLREIRFLDRVERGEERGLCLRDMTPDDAAAELVPYHRGDEVGVPYRVLVATEPSADGPFRSNALGRSLFSVGAHRGLHVRVKTAAVLAAVAFAAAALIATL